MTWKTVCLWLSIPAAAAAGYLCRPHASGAAAVAPAAGMNAAMPARERTVSEAVVRCQEIKELVESNPGAAESMAHSDELGSLLSIWAAQDRRSAVEWAAALPPPLRDHALGSVLSFIATAFPDDLLTWLPLLRDEELDGRIIRIRGAGMIASSALRSLLDRDVRAALEWLRPRWHDLSQGSYDARRLLESELRAAITAGRLSFKDAFMALPAGEHYTLGHIWHSLPAPRLAEAAEWLKSAPDRKMMNLLPSMIGEWAVADASAATAFIGTIDDTGIREEAWRVLGHRARSLWNHIPEDRRAGILAAHLAERERNSPDSFFPGDEYAPLAESLATSPDKTKAVASVAALWGASDPLRALAWSSGLADAAMRESATEAAMDGWAAEESWGASQWILQQPAGPQRDVAARSLSRAITADEPDSAWRWAREIANPEMRLAASAAVLKKWMPIDSAAAGAALAALPQSEQPGSENSGLPSPE